MLVTLKGLGPNHPLWGNLAHQLSSMCWLGWPSNKQGIFFIIFVTVGHGSRIIWQENSKAYVRFCGKGLNNVILDRLQRDIFISIAHITYTSITPIACLSTVNYTLSNLVLLAFFNQMCLSTSLPNKLQDFWHHQLMQGRVPTTVEYSVYIHTHTTWLKFFLF